MSDSVFIDVARDFSPYCGGRNIVDGPFSAEALRVEHLAPALADGGSIVVDLDGGIGFASSFLEEAFGGLVRSHGASVMQRVDVVSTTRPHRARCALRYMSEAVERG